MHTQGALREAWSQALSFEASCAKKSKVQRRQAVGGGMVQCTLQPVRVPLTPTWGWWEDMGSDRVFQSTHLMG